MADIPYLFKQIRSHEKFDENLLRLCLNKEEIADLLPFSLSEVGKFCDKLSLLRNYLKNQLNRRQKSLNEARYLYDELSKNSANSPHLKFHTNKISRQISEKLSDIENLMKFELNSQRRGDIQAVESHLQDIDNALDLIFNQLNEFMEKLEHSSEGRIAPTAEKRKNTLYSFTR